MLRFIIFSLFLYFMVRVIRVLLMANKNIKKQGGSGFTSGFQGFRQSPKSTLDEIEEADFTVIKDDSESKNT